MSFTDPYRFNQRFWKTSICKFWERGTCKRGQACMFAHGEHELRDANSDAVPAHIEQVRAEQDHIYEQRRLGWQTDELSSSSGGGVRRC